MKWVLVFCLQVLLVLPTQAGSFDDYLIPDATEKPKIAELKTQLDKRVPHEYMKEDGFILRFLRDKDLDVPMALDMILKMVRWREDNKIDTIMTEDFGELEGIFPTFIEGCDKGGRPVMSVAAADTDFNALLLRTDEYKLKRFTMKIFEEATIMLRRMNAEGEKVSQVTILFDMEGFSLINHACPRCIPIYLYILDSFQANYPGYIHKIVAFNTPKYALPLWDTYKGAATPRLRETVKTYGNERPKWEKFIKAEIADTELTAHYGGTKPKNLDQQVLRKSGKVFKCATPFSDYVVKA